MTQTVELMLRYSRLKYKGQYNIYKLFSSLFVKNHGVLSTKKKFVLRRMYVPTTHILIGCIYEGNVYFDISHDVASGSEITPFIIYKVLVAYSCWKRYEMTSIAIKLCMQNEKIIKLYTHSKISCKSWRKLKRKMKL